MVQRWREVLFLHWPVDASELRALIPGPLELDTFEGPAWPGSVPLRLAAVRLRGRLPLPHRASASKEGHLPGHETRALARSPERNSPADPGCPHTQEELARRHEDFPHTHE